MFAAFTPEIPHEMYTMRRLSFLFLMFVLASSLGCKGCDDSTGSTNNDVAINNGEPDTGVLDDTCVDADDDGYPSGLTCSGRVDCDDSNPEIKPRAEEVCGDGADNDCDGTIDEGCPDCPEGESRGCGTDEGRCTAGTQTCTDGVWTECLGAEGPFNEECNGEDDDCDGEIDENGDILCDDGKLCTGVEACVAGACVASDPVDCSMLDGPCQTGECSEKDGGCRAFEKENGSTCDDGNFCTEGGTCQTGECQTTPRDCSAADDQCNVGVCDEAADACVPQPRSDGTTCDDGEFCTVSDTCAAGVCGGGDRDCSGAADQCNSGVCDEAADACVAQPVINGTSCEDGRYCTVGDACQAGQCTSGGPRSCGAQGGSCRTGVCDEATDSCTGDPVPDGTACDDGEFCTTSDSCVAGTCAGGAPRTCPNPSACRLGTCNETLNACASTSAPNGTTCNDGAFCTAGDTCTNGTCSGSARDCSGVADSCNTGSCSESMDACVKQPRSDGTACPDSLYCTINELCVAGSCSTAPRDCSSASDQCNNAACDDTADACVPTPRANGTACNDGQFCTENDACQSGYCSGGGAFDCSFATMGNSCLIATCDEIGDECDVSTNPNPPANAVCCNPLIDADLDGSNQCNDCDDANGAAYPGAPEFCNGFDDDCDGMIDEDFDIDGDGYSICSTDPNVFDCNDNVAAINPGATEICGNDIDEDCDGYKCPANCSNADADGDGVTECNGDCDDSDPAVSPNRPELCDGKDNDCNVLTTPNCGVSDRCNFDLDGNPDNDADECRSDMICACVLTRNGTCNNDYRCTSFCNTSVTGALGDGCQADQTCQFDLVASAGVHGCGVSPDPVGSLLGGQTGVEDNCRSLDTLKFVGPGGVEFCYDYCGSDAYCDAPGTTCVMYGGHGRCFPDSRTGNSPIGTSCTTDSACDHNACITDPNTSRRYCSEPCCTDSDCGSGYTCSLAGTATDTNYVFPSDSSTSCSSAADCGAGQGDVCFNGACAWRLVDTNPVCVKDVSGQGSRQAGNACTANSQCASNFCERDLGVCIDVCCSDATCPSGLTCEFVRAQTTSKRASAARVCLNLSTDDILRRK